MPALSPHAPLALESKGGSLWLCGEADAVALRGRARFDATDTVLLRNQSEPGLARDPSI